MPGYYEDKVRQYKRATPIYPELESGFGWKKLSVNKTPELELI